MNEKEDLVEMETVHRDKQSKPLDFEFPINGDLETGAGFETGRKLLSEVVDEPRKALRHESVAKAKTAEKKELNVSSLNMDDVIDDTGESQIVDFAQPHLI